MIKISDFSSEAPAHFKKKETKEKTKLMAEEIAELAGILFAQRKNALLIVFQGMDSSGKDGATKNIFQSTSPSFVAVKGFKKPTDEEFSHDFLWRISKEAPSKGQIKIFVRSHYEDILIQRVHKWINEEKVTNRINAINAWEESLVNDNNTTVLKFYMHLSNERQLEKLQERIDDPSKQWKHNPGDWEERKYWDEYIRCYEDAINRSRIPWIIAPVDSRWYRDYFIADKILTALKAMKLELPTLPKDGES